MECWKPTCTAQKSSAFTKTGVWCAVSQKWIVGPLFFEETYTAENYPNLYTQFVALLERNELNRWFQQHMENNRLWKVKQLSCWISSLTALAEVDFGHHDPQTLHHLTSFCENFLKKKSTAITQETWRTENTTLSRLLPELTNKLFEKFQKPLWKGWMIIFTRRSCMFK